MGVNTTSTFSGKIPNEYFERKALENVKKNLVAYDLGRKYKFPKGEGKTMQFFQYNKFSIDTSALSEGVPPTEQAMALNSTSVDLSQYGNFVKISDWAQDITVSDSMDEAMKLIETQASESIDKIVLNVLDAALPNQFANGESALTSVGSNDVLTAKELLKAYVTLAKNDVMKFGQIYKGIMHPACIGDLFNDTNVGSANDIFKYTSNSDILKVSLPVIYGVQMWLSSNISSTTTGTESSATVYSNPIVGMDAFAVLDLESRKSKGNFEIIIKQNGSSGIADPLNQIASVGYKIHGFAAKYLGGVGTNPDLGVRVRAGSQF